MKNELRQNSITFHDYYLSFVASEESCMVPQTLEVADELPCAGSKLRRVPARLVSTSTTAPKVPSMREDRPCCLLCRKSRDESLHNADVACLCPWRTLSSWPERSSFVRFTEDFEWPPLWPLDDSPPPALITPRPPTTWRLGVCNPGECSVPGVGPLELSQTRDTCSSRILCALSSVSLSVITERSSIEVNGKPSTAVVLRAHALGIEERTDTSSTWLASLSYNAKISNNVSVEHHASSIIAQY